MAEEAVVNLKINSNQAQKSLEKFGLTMESVKEEAAEPLTFAISELEDRLYELAAAGRQGDKEFSELAKEVGRLKKTVLETDAVVDGFAEGVGVSLGGAMEGVAGGFALAQGAMGAFGAESEKIEEAMLRVQSAMSIAQGVESLRRGAKGFKALKVQAVSAFNGMSKASKAFAVTGIGLLLTAVAAAVVYFEDLKKMFGSVSKETTAMQETMEDYSNAAQSATKKVMEVGNAFELAKDGVISKQEALDKYNETLGPVLGQAEDLNEAERIYREKTDAYIQATALRAQADALLAKAAEESVKGLTAAQENQVSATDNALAGVASYFGFATVANDQLAKGQEKGIKRAQKQAKENADLFSTMAEDMLKKANEIEKANDIISDPAKEKQRADARAKSADEAAKAAEREAALQSKLAAEREAARMEQEQAEEEAIERYNNAILSKHEKELQDVRDHYFNLIGEAEQYGLDTTILEEKRQSEINAINDRYAQEAIKRRDAQIQAELSFTQKQIEIDQALAQQKRSNLDATIDAFAQFSGKSKAIALGIIAIQKGLAIADVITNTSKTLGAISASSAEVLAKKFAAYATIPGGQAIALAEAAPILAANAKLAAATKIGAGIQIASIAATGITQASGVLNAGVNPTTGVSASSSSPTAPTFDTLGDSGVNQLAQTLGQQNQVPVKAFVVSGDVTSAQQLDRNKIQNATL